MDTIASVPQTATPETAATRRRPPHAAWSTRQLAAYLGRCALPGLTLPAYHLLLVLACCADDRSGEVRMAVDALADRAGCHRSTVYRHLGELESSGLVIYRPGQISRGRGHASRWRIVKTAVAAAMLAAQRAADAAATARRDLTAQAAATLGTVRRSLGQRLRDTRWKTSHSTTHPAPSGAGEPAPAPLRHDFIGDRTADLYCWGCQLPPTHPRHGVSLTTPAP